LTETTGEILLAFLPVFARLCGLHGSGGDWLWLWLRLRLRAPHLHVLLSGRCRFWGSASPAYAWATN
jgi:hypothetical protein